MKHLLILLSIVGIYFTAMSQRINPSKIAEPKEAIDNFLAQNYLKALPQLLELFKKDSLNIEYNQYIGVCYLNTYIDKSKAIPYLEYVTKQKKYDFYAWYDLGLSYMHSSRFDDAIKAFNEFITLKKGKDINSIPAERQSVPG